MVFCDYEQQIERLQQRNHLTQQQAIARIKNQLPLAEKIARADVVLDNSDCLDFLHQQIDQIFK